MTDKFKENERKLRERQFHNKLFSGTSTRSFDSFYEVARPCTEDFEKEILSRARNKVVLEYGCGPGTNSFRLAKVATRVIGIDISEVAIDRARSRAVKAGATNVEFRVMDGEAPAFPDNTFDFVCGRAIIHHLDLNRCFDALRRIIRPTGAAAFHEPLGHNPAINLMRAMTPHLRTIDEHPLMMKDLVTARSFFDTVVLRSYVLTSLAAVPFYRTRLFRPTVKMLSCIDAALLTTPLRRYGWTSIWTMEGPRK